MSASSPTSKEAPRQLPPIMDGGPANAQPGNGDSDSALGSSSLMMKHQGTGGIGSSVGSSPSGKTRQTLGHMKRVSLWGSTTGRHNSVPESAEDGTEFGIEEIGVDWQLVLTNLQREKKRNTARQEEQYVNRSLFFLESSSRVREAFIKVAEANWFSALSLGAILVNCIFMVFDDPVCACEDFDKCSEAENYKRLLYNINCFEWDHSLKYVMARSEQVFTALFGAEMFVKIIARGFIMHKHAYLRDMWNWIDFVVVCTSILSLATSLGNVQVLRTVRVLKPLRTMTKIQGMKPLIKTLVGAFKNIVNVISLLMFFFVVFGIFGSDLLSRKLRGRCFIDPKPEGGGNNWSAVPSVIRDRLESQWIPYIDESNYNPGTKNGGITICSMDDYGNEIGGTQCDPVTIDGVELNTVCSFLRWCHTDWCAEWYLDNPMDFGWGYMSYDNILQSFITIFQVLTNEGWVDIVYRLEAGWSVWGSRVFHTLWVIIGSFFVIQLALAVLADSFVQAQEDAKTEKEREALHDEAILRRIEVPAEKHKRSKSVLGKADSTRLDGGLNSGSGGGTAIHPWYSLPFWRSSGNKGNGGSSSGGRAYNSIVSGLKLIQDKTRQLVFNKWFSRGILCVIILNTCTMMIDHHNQDVFEDSVCKRRCEIDPMISVGGAKKCVGPLFNRTWDTNHEGGGARPQQTVFCFMEDDAEVDFNYAWGESKCSLQNETGCAMTLGGNGMPCHWFNAMTWHGAELPGKCKASLYTSDNFAQNAPVGYNGAITTVSFRHLCGDAGEKCPSADSQMADVIEMINQVLTYIFIVEMVLKMVGMGLTGYFSERFNQFDCIIVMMSIVDIVVTASSEAGAQSSGVSSLRGMRLLRLFKLARSWKSMRKILNTLGIALGNLKALTIVWAMFMYIFALLCMQMFGGKFKTTKTADPRSNFDSFGPSPVGHGAFLIVFQIITTENWNTILYNTMQVGSFGGGGGTPAYALFTIVIVLFGNYIIMNLFISILLQGFDEDDENTENEENDAKNEEPTPPKIGPAQRTLARFRLFLGPRYAKVFNLQQHNASTRNVTDLGQSLRALGGMPQGPNSGESDGEQIDPLKALALAAANTAQLETIVPEEDRDDGLYKRVFFKPMNRQVRLPAHKAMFCLKPTNFFRVGVAAIVQHPIFERLILVAILTTSVILCIDHPMQSIEGDLLNCPAEGLNCSGLAPGQTELINCDRSPTDENWGRVWAACDSGDPDNIHPCCWAKSQQEIYNVLDKFFTIVFLCEMLMKMVESGIILHEHAYLRNVWNWLDFFIVIISMIGFVPDSSGSLKTLKSLRTVRVLRPLRVIKRHPGLKIAVVCLISSLPAMGNVAVVVLVWFSMWAMFGVQLFKGKLYRCYDAANMVWYGTPSFPGGSLYTAAPIMSGAESVPTMIECVAAGGGGVGQWEDRSYSFNNYPVALLTCFSMATTEGWLDVMAAHVDATSTGVTPLGNYNPWAGLYAAVHIVLGAFVLLNLIVGSVINNYNRVKALNNGVTPFTTPEQQEWKETQRIIFNLKPMARKNGPSNPFRQWCFKVVEHTNFELAITFVIVMNVITMMTRTHNQTDCMTTAMYWFNVFFLVVFIVEAIMKLVGLGPKWYFMDTWNMFDFVVVILSIVMIGLDTAGGDWTCDPNYESGLNVEVPGLSVLRVFRIARVFRLVRRLKGLRQMIATLINSLPSLSNIFSLIVLMLIIFSVLCVTFFYNVNVEQDAYGSMGDEANYRTLSNALYLLHRQTTGEAWNAIMMYCAAPDPYQSCARAYGPFLGEGCGNLPMSVVIHVFWQLFGTYTMMQLFTAVIIENFHELAKGEAFVLPMHKLNEFVDIWTELDPNASQKIDVGCIPTLVQRLPPPMGLAGKPTTPSTLMQVIKDLAIPIRDGTVTYKETFVACVKRVMDQDIEDEDDSEGEDEEGEGTSHRFHARHGGDDDKIPAMFRGRRVTAAEDFAARSVQQGYRDWREKRLQVMKAVHRTADLPLEGSLKDLRHY